MTTVAAACLAANARPVTGRTCTVPPVGEGASEDRADGPAFFARGGR